MAYLGTPIDTRNQFQSLQGKRFNGDGSTTDFTLDVAPSSTLDIEVFVGNVRQDPNSAYTVSGTTLSFTGAPPSGTNNIYVVHQAKAVGTIDLPVGALVDLNGGSDKLVLDADGDTTISADTDDQIDIKIAGSDSLRIKANEIENVSGDLTIDAATDIILDADGADIHLQDGGTHYGSLTNSSSDFAIRSQVSDKDIIFKGNDGGSEITALTIDMSAAGDLLQGTSAKISSNGAIANFTNHNGSATETTLASSDGNEKVRCFNSGVVTFESGGTEGMRLNGDDVTVSRANNFTNNGTGGGSGIRLSDVGGTRGEIGVEKTGTSAAGMIYFYNGNGTVGAIVTDGSSTSYNTSSDYRLKENAVAISDGITRLKTLKPYRFNFKADKDKTVDGFFAHEVTAVPEAIQGEKDGAEMQSIDQAKLVPLLTAALKEAITKIETLEARVTTLEG